MEGEELRDYPVGNATRSVVEYKLSSGRTAVCLDISVYTGEQIKIGVELRNVIAREISIQGYRVRKLVSWPPFRKMTKSFPTRERQDVKSDISEIIKNDLNCKKPRDIYFSV